MRQISEREQKKKDEDAEAKKNFLASIKAEKDRERYITLVEFKIHLLMILINLIRLIKNIISMKVKDMKETRIPDRFVKDVEKQLKVTVV